MLMINRNSSCPGISLEPVISQFCKQLTKIGSSCTTTIFSERGPCAAGRRAGGVETLALKTATIKTDTGPAACLQDLRDRQPATLQSHITKQHFSPMLAPQSSETSLPTH